MAKKTVSKKRSDFTSAAEYRRWKNRSNASKKAWRERKSSALRVKIDEARQPRPIRGLKPSAIPTPIIPDGLTVKQLEKLLQESERRRIAAEAQLAAEILTRDFVDSEELAKLRRNMAIALEPSRLRHLGVVTDEMERMLEKAGKKGKRALRKQAKEYAEYFDVPIREVYTLFFSP